MIRLFITFDYELYFGKRTGTPERCLIQPSARIAETLFRHGARATFFVDTGYLMALKRQRNQIAVLDRHYRHVLGNLQSLVEAGHELQLHIHPHWEDSFHDGERWRLNTLRYRLHDFPQDQIAQMVEAHCCLLADISGARPVAFRAGGWCVQPFDRLAPALSRSGIQIDSSVFRGGKSASQTHYYDFTQAPSGAAWRFDDDPLTPVQNGAFLEIPISRVRTPPLFYWRLIYTRYFGAARHRAYGDGTAIQPSLLDKLRMLSRPSDGALSLDGLKSDLLRQHLASLAAQAGTHAAEPSCVLIGHPKALTEHALQNLDALLTLPGLKSSLYSEVNL